MPKISKKKMAKKAASSNGECARSDTPRKEEKKTTSGTNRISEQQEKSTTNRKSQGEGSQSTNGSEAIETTDIDLASNPNLMLQIGEDIQSMGLVGEDNAGKLLYVVATSRNLKKPLGVIIRGLSGSGKSEVPKQVVPLIPPDDVVHATSQTAQALYYGEQDWLKNKFVVGGERSHRTDDDVNNGQKT